MSVGIAREPKSYRVKEVKVYQGPKLGNLKCKGSDLTKGEHI